MRTKTISQQRSLADDRAAVTFIVKPPFVSGNRAKSHRVMMGNKGKPIVVTYRTREAQAFLERVKVTAIIAARRAGWRTIPAWIRLDLTVFNSRLDRDNVNKTVQDALQGALCINDSRVIDGNLCKRWDQGGERLEVRVAAVNPTDYGRT